MHNNRFQKHIGRVLVLTVLFFLLVSLVPLAAADSYTTDFETFTVGNVNGQDGWKKTGSYDVAIVDQATLGLSYAGFGSRSLRISNKVTSSSFSDHAFSSSTVDEAGETNALNGGFSGGTRQRFYESSMDFASADPLAEQAGLGVTLSPDRGDGARMSWIRIDDTPTGLEVSFNGYDTTLGGTCNDLTNFTFSTIATGLDRAQAHNLKVTMSFYDGINNDVVRVYVDGALVHVDKSWEDYFRNCELSESRTVDSMLFRVSGAAAPGTAGKGLLFDNFSVTTGEIPPALVDPIMANPVVCDKGTVDIQVTDVDNLYGYQFKVTYNKDLVTAKGKFKYGFFDTDADGSTLTGWNAACSDGVCRFARTEKYPDGPVSGTGVLASIDFDSLLPAAPDAFDVEVTDLTLTNRDGYAINADPGSIAVNVCGNATVSGKVSLQGRPHVPGVDISEPGRGFEVKLVGPLGTFAAPPTINYANGQFTIAGVKYLTGGTTYTIQADHSLYLKAEKTPLLVNGNITGQNTTLLGGDANNNGGVGVGDLSCIGGVFDTVAPPVGDGTCGANPLSSPDINDDDYVNIQDLSIAGGNFSLADPQGW